MRKDPGLWAAIEAAGGVRALGRLLDISAAAVAQWQRVPERHIVEVELGTGVSRDILRPDLFFYLDTNREGGILTAGEITRLATEPSPMTLSVDHEVSSAAPAARIRSSASPPAAAAPTKWASIIAEMDRLNLTYRLEPQYDLDQLDTADRRIQIRENEHVAPKETVTRFAIQMSHSEFPPIIVTRDAWVVDGNTRREAKKQRGEKFHPAFVLDLALLKASPHERNTLTILGATLNAANGLPLTAPERRRTVQAMVQENWKNEQIARALGIAPSVVTQVKRELDAAAKLQRVQVSPSGAMTTTGLRALGTPDVLALNDAPYRDLAVLANDAGLGFNEIREIAKNMKETGSDQGALAAIAEKRAEMRERIGQHTLTGNGKPPAAAILRARLGYIVNHVGHESALVERGEENVEKHLAAIDAAIAVLTRVRELQVS